MNYHTEDFVEIHPSEVKAGDICGAGYEVLWPMFRDPKDQTRWVYCINYNGELLRLYCYFDIFHVYRPKSRIARLFDHLDKVMGWKM